MTNRTIELVSFIDAMGVALVITLIPFFTKELGVGAFGFGVITSLYGFCQIIGGSIIGYLSNGILSRKTILLLSSIGSGVSYSMLLIRGSISSLVFSRVLVGLVKQSTTSCKALAMMSRDDHSPQRFSLIAAVRHMGSFVGSFLLSLITKHYPEEFAILLCVFLYVIESIIISVFIPEDTTFPSNSPSKESSSVNQQLLQTFDGVFVMYFFYLLSIDTLNKGFGSIKIVLLQEQFNVSPSQIGMVYVLSNLYMFLTEFLITPFLSRLLPPLRLVSFSLLLLMAGKLSQLLLSSFDQYIVFCVLLNTVGEEVFATTFVTLLSQITPETLINAYLSLYDVVESVCRLVGPVVLGKITAQFGYVTCQKVLVVLFCMLLCLWKVLPVWRKEKVECHVCCIKHSYLEQFICCC